MMPCSTLQQFQPFSVPQIPSVKDFNQDDIIKVKTKRESSEIKGEDLLPKVNLSDLQCPPQQYQPPTQIYTSVQQQQEIQRSQMGQKTSSYGMTSLNCSICGRQCLNPAQMITHLRTHTGEKPYTCQVCGKGFIQKGNMQTHQKKYHDMRQGNYQTIQYGVPVNQMSTNLNPLMQNQFMDTSINYSLLQGFQQTEETQQKFPNQIMSPFSNPQLVPQMPHLPSLPPIPEMQNIELPLQIKSQQPNFYNNIEDSNQNSSSINDFLDEQIRKESLNQNPYVNPEEDQKLHYQDKSDKNLVIFQDRVLLTEWRHTGFNLQACTQ